MFGKSCETISRSLKTFIKENKLKSVGNGANIYFFNQQVVEGIGCFSTRCSVNLYSSATKNWINVPATIDEKFTYSICSFMQKLFLFCADDLQTFSGYRIIYLALKLQLRLIFSTNSAALRSLVFDILVKTIF